MMNNKETLQPFFDLIQRSKEDLLSELLSEQNQRTQRAFWGVADLLAEPEIDIQLDIERMKELVRGWNKKRGNKVTFRARHSVENRRSRRK